MKNTGKEYEFFVANLQQALLDAEEVTNQKNITIEVNKKIVDNNGIEREFDIYWEYELGGFTYKTVIECKDYASNISIEKIDALIGKTQDITGLKAVFATKKGYQSGAKIKAEKNSIDLLIVREQNHSDWSDMDGNPLIKLVNIHMRIHAPAHIKKFEPMLDGNWIKENTSIDPSKPMIASGLNNEIFIEDLIKNEKYSLHELAGKLTTLKDKDSGTFEKIEKFEHAFLYHNNLKLKLSGYRIEYSISKPIDQKIEFDFSKELIGVIEYLQKGVKKSIFKDGRIK